MIVRLRHWYLAKSLREQRLLLLMAAIGIPTLAWLLIIMPLNQAYDSALDRHVEAIDRNGRVKMLAAAPPAGAPAQLPSGSDLGLVIVESAGAAGITLDSNAADGPNSVAITIASGTVTSILQWLQQLEGQGIVVDDLRLAPGPDGTASATARLTRTVR